MRLICVHDGAFHADDVMGAAILLLLHPEATVLRSRDPLDWARCDALVDVGGEYDPERNRFDHHQKGFAERRGAAQGAIPFAGAGLAWRSYGAMCVKTCCPTLSVDEALQIAHRVDEALIQHIDAVDSGIHVPGPQAFSFTGIIDTFNATWLEGDDGQLRFETAVGLAQGVLCRLIRAKVAEWAAQAEVLSAETACDGRVLVLSRPRVPFDHTVCAHLPDVRFVVYPTSNDGQHQLRVVPVTPGSFVARAQLPAAWAGLRDADLAAVTGVADAVFCHNGRFIAGARSKEGALKLAGLAAAGLNGGAACC